MAVGETILAVGAGG